MTEPKPYEKSKIYQSSNMPVSSSDQKFVDGHNEYRRDVNPPATNMTPVQWSDELAGSAKNWADQCIWQHSGTRGVGENIYATSKRISNFDPYEAMNSWGDEKKDYDYETNRCKPGKVCGHYTQMVWADSKKIGCAVKDCPKLQNLNWPNGGTFVVCQYDPPGNYIGQKPYRSK